MSFCIFTVSSMLDVLSPAANFQEDDCRVCYHPTGFSTLCNAGDNREHSVCFECVVKLFLLGRNNLFLCPFCRTQFNFQDFLVVRELHLIQLQSEESMLAYATIMGNNPLQGSVVEKFLLLGEESQIEMISKMYWGNDRLFDEDDDYPTNIAQNKSIKKNLLEILGDPWSLDEVEKNRRLAEVFTNGWLVKFCQNETKETFLHRCHLFLRANLPLHRYSNQYILCRMRNVQKFFPEYTPTLNVFNRRIGRLLALPVVERPGTGPLHVEKLEHGLELFYTVRWTLLKELQILNGKDLEDNLAEVCAMCNNNPGFPILCEGEHKLCLDCVVILYQSTPEQLCGLCQTEFNFYDYLVVREFCLIHSRSEQSVLNYFHRMMPMGPMPNSNALLFKNFLWLEKNEQQEILSNMYWGNGELFANNEQLGYIGCYPSQAEKNQRIKDNLLEIFGDLWSPQLGRKEKDRKLLEAFTNGCLIKSCQNESEETFLHRCHLFLRIFLPRNANCLRNFVARMQMAEFFPEYYGLQYRIVPWTLQPMRKPVTGPIHVESVSPMWFVDRYGSVKDVSDLKKDINRLYLFNTSALLCSLLSTTLVGFGRDVVISVILIYLIFFVACLIFSVLYCQSSEDSIKEKIKSVSRVRKFISYNTVGIIVGISLSLFVYHINEVFWL